MSVCIELFCGSPYPIGGDHSIHKAADYARVLIVPLFQMEADSSGVRVNEQFDWLASGEDGFFYYDGIYYTDLSVHGPDYEGIGHRYEVAEFNPTLAERPTAIVIDSSVLEFLIELADIRREQWDAVASGASEEVAESVAELHESTAEHGQKMVERISEMIARADKTMARHA